jgi:hypothetical protein
MSHKTGHRWIISWEDESGDPDHGLRETADTSEEAQEVIHRFLEGFDWTPEDAGEIQPPLDHPVLPERIERISCYTT